MKTARLPLALLLSSLFAAAACGGGETDASSSGAGGASAGGAAGAAGSTSMPASIVAGDARLDVAADGSITLLQGMEPRLTLPLAGLVLGTVDKVTDTENYDPWFMAIGQHKDDPEGLAFESPKGAVVKQTSPTEIDVVLTYPSGEATLHLASPGPGRFAAKLTPKHEKTAYFRLRPRVDAKEGLYGLGEQLDSVDNRGKLRPMQLEAGAMNEAGYTQNHVPVPFVVGTKGWGLFVEDPHPAVFDAAKGDPEIVEVTYGTGLASKNGLVFHLYAAAHPLDVTKAYYETTGFPKLPARWALGPWLWRDENKDQAEVMSDIQKMRSLDLAHSALWVDRPYASAVNTFDFDPVMFTDPKAMIAEAHAQGFRMGLWHTPYVDAKDPKAKAMLDEVTKGGFFPKVQGLLLNKWGTPLDFTNPAAVAYWQGKIHLYTDAGIEGFKLDYGEDILPGISGLRNQWVFADGSDERTMNTLYTGLYHQTYAKTLPEDGYFLLCRAGKYGGQKNGVVIWPGDLDASFAKAGEMVDDGKDKYVAVGGFLASVIAGTSLGPSGYPFYGADTGGYIHSPPDKELFQRWFEQTALSTVMQIGNGSSTAVWDDFSKTGYDQGTVDAYRAYVRLHTRLFPYEWTYAKELEKTGRPIQRPLGLAHPELGVHPDDQYLFGEHLLVAPVVERSAVTKTLTPPKGAWVHWLTGEVVQGGAAVTVDAPLGRLPLFLKEGGIVPLLRPTIDTLSPSTAPDVDSFANDPGVLWARVFAGPKSTFALYDGAEIGQEGAAQAVTLTTKDGAEFQKGFALELHVPQGKATGATLDGAPLGVSDGSMPGYLVPTDAPSRVVVFVPKGTHTVVVSLSP